MLGVYLPHDGSVVKTLRQTSPIVADIENEEYAGRTTEFDGSNLGRSGNIVQSKLKENEEVKVKNNHMKLLRELFSLGIQDPSLLLAALQKDPFNVHGDPEQFECPADAYKLDFPSLINETRSQLFREKDASSWIFYQHMRKAGGTGFCELVKSNVPRKQIPPYYCMPDNRGSLATSPWNDPSYLLQRMSEKSYKVASNEWDVLPTNTLPKLHGAVFVSTFRHPVDRWYSQYRFEHLEHRDGSAPTAPRKSFITWYKNNHKGFMGSNYYIKTYVGDVHDGQPVTQPPPNPQFYWTYTYYYHRHHHHQYRELSADQEIPITWGMFEDALKNVRQFHLILILEWMNSADGLLKSVLNWNQHATRVRPHESAKEKENRPAASSLSGKNESLYASLVPPQDFSFILQDNALDLLFFHALRRIYVERLACSRIIL